MTKVRSLLYMAMMTTIIIILGLIPAIPLGFIPVPIVLQNLGIMLAGVLLNGKKGTMSVILFLILGLVIPVFTGGGMTVSVLSGPTAGYVLAWVFVPLLIDGGLKRFKKTSFISMFFIIFIFGALFVDIIGSIWLSMYSHIPLPTSLISNLVFLPGDTLKVIVTTLISYKYGENFKLLINRID